MSGGSDEWESLRRQAKKTERVLEVGVTRVRLNTNHHLYPKQTPANQTQKPENISFVSPVHLFYSQRQHSSTFTGKDVGILSPWAEGER
jgi:hypothetical protein